MGEDTGIYPIFLRRCWLAELLGGWLAVSSCVAVISVLVVNLSTIFPHRPLVRRRMRCPSQLSMWFQTWQADLESVTEDEVGSSSVIFFSISTFSTSSRQSRLEHILYSSFSIQKTSWSVTILGEAKLPDLFLLKLGLLQRDFYTPFKL